MLTIEPTTLAYLAGVIDGDGYISITRSVRSGRVYFGPQVGIAGTRREPHDLAASIWGGKVSRYDPKNPVHRPQYQWSRVGAVAAEVVAAIEPYLLVKKDQAGVALLLYDHLELGRTDDPFPWYGPHFDPTHERDELWAEMVGMNQSRNRLRSRAAGRLLDGREWSEFPEVHT